MTVQTHPLDKSCLHRYHVPVVGLDLPPAEALSQSLDALKHLDGVINDIFGRLSSRIKTERSRMQDVSQRVVAAKTLVDHVAANQDKVTTIKSAAKYPCPEKPFYFEQLACAVNQHELSEVAKAVPVFPKNLRNAVAKEINTNALFDELSMARAQHIDHENDDQQKEGLGRLPTYLPSVSSILLFNSSENPYKKYQSINNLEGVDVESRAKLTAELAAAPTSLLEGAMLPTFAGEEYLFERQMQDKPTFDLPQNLPLAMLAMNIGFGAEGASSIAPSVNPMAHLPVPALMPPSASAAPPPPSYSAAPPAPSAPPPSRASAPPPPGPPAPPAPRAPSAPTGPPAPPGAPAPPPPPAPPGAPPPPAAPAPPAASGGGGRGDLLSAIRDAKKNVKLKRVDDKENKDSSAVKPADDAGGVGVSGDMMDMLKARLLRLRKGVKGETPAPGGGGGGGGGDKKLGTMADVVFAASQSAKQAPKKNDDDHDEADWAV